MHLIIYCTVFPLSSKQEVLVMVPTLTSVDDPTQNRALTAPFLPYFPPHMSGQLPVSDQQSDQQSDQGQSQKHPYPQPYQQQYHQHYHQQQQRYQFQNEREQSPPQQQEYLSPFYARAPQGHPYGHGWGSDADQYSNRTHNGGYAQDPKIKSSQSRSHDEDEERDQYTKK
jgi:hypothetical protein